MRDIAAEPIGRVWPQALFTFALQALAVVARSASTGLAGSPAIGRSALNWSSLQYTDHAWSPRDVHEGAWNLRFWPITQAIFLNYNLHLVHHRAAATFHGSICRALRPDDPNPSFWSIYLLALGRRPSGAARARRRAAAAAASAQARPRDDGPAAEPAELRRLATGIVGCADRSRSCSFRSTSAAPHHTGLRGHRLHLYAHWELALPFWPSMVVPYLSMFVLFLMPPLQLDAERACASWCGGSSLPSLIGGVVFLCLPSQLGFAERTDAGIWQPLYDGIYAIDSRSNTVPSFHVIYTASILLALMAWQRRGCAGSICSGLSIVCASTVLTHRHHLLDVAAGLAIALAVRRRCCPRPPAIASTEPT